MDAKIAAGGFGAIYRTTHVKSGHEFALKVLHANLTTDPNVVARFRREGAALTRLRDPHTITAYELGEAPDGTLYIVMELLHGESLYERFRTQGPIPWRRMMMIARAVCSSLAEAHAHGIIHRDLKPTNIHLEPRATQSEFVKVLDFGIAKILQGSDIDSSDLTQTGQMIGTLDYMSPEQMVGGMCNATCDIYTLGLVMYEMIAGRKPFDDANSAASALAAVLTTTPPRLSEVAIVTPEVDRLVMRCLERQYVDRFQTAAELAHALDDVLSGRIEILSIATGHVDDSPTGRVRAPLDSRPTVRAVPRAASDPVVPAVQVVPAELIVPAPAASAEPSAAGARVAVEPATSAAAEPMAVAHAPAPIASGEAANPSGQSPNGSRVPGREATASGEAAGVPEGNWHSANPSVADKPTVRVRPAVLPRQTPVTVHPSPSTPSGGQLAIAPKVTPAAGHVARDTPSTGHAAPVAPKITATGTSELPTSRVTPPSGHPVPAAPAVSAPRVTPSTGAAAAPFDPDAGIPVELEQDGRPGHSTSSRFPAPRTRAGSAPLPTTPLRSLRESHPTIHRPAPSPMRPPLTSFDDLPTALVGASTPLPVASAPRRDPAARGLGLWIALALALIAALLVAGGL